MTHEEFKWMAEAACRDEDPEIFFETRNRKVQEAAREVCKSCPVKTRCINYAWQLDRLVFLELGYRLDGLWGTVTKGERVGVISNEDAVKRRGFAANQGSRRGWPDSRR